MPAKLLRCVKKVGGKNSKVNPWAICIVSTGLKPHKLKSKIKK